MLCILIYILLLYRLSAHLWFFPSENQILSKVSIICLKSRYPPEGALLSRLRLRAHQTLRFPRSQRRPVRKPYNNPMFFQHYFFNFSKSHWELHFRHIFDIASTCRQGCGPSTVPYFSLNHKTHTHIYIYIHIYIYFQWNFNVLC